MTKTKSRRKRALHKVEKRDLALAQAVAVDKRSGAGRAIATFADLGDQPPLRVLCAAVIGAGLAGQNRKLLRTGLRMLLAHSVATLGKAFIKDNVDRSRPDKALSGRYKMAKGQSRSHELQSMPSGHSAGVAAVAASVIADYPAAAGPVLGASSAVLGAQLPSKNHFLSDVAVGSAIGLVAFGLARWLLPPTEDA